MTLAQSIHSLPAKATVAIAGRSWSNGCETDDGDIWLHLHSWGESRTRERWYGAPELMQVRYVSVISRYAHGEVRGYWLDEHGRLWLAGPCHSGAWPEMDHAVATALWAQLVPYRVLAGSQVEHLR